MIFRLGETIVHFGKPMLANGRGTGTHFRTVSGASTKTAIVLEKGNWDSISHNRSTSISGPYNQCRLHQGSTKAIGLRRVAPAPRYRQLLRHLSPEIDGHS
jgi:hypothetical protein